MKDKRKLRLLLFGGLGVLIAGALVCTLLWGKDPTGSSVGNGALSGLGGGGAGTLIRLDDGGSTVSGTGASVSGERITIRQGGTYTVTGTLSQGQIYVEAGGSDTVTLRLAGMELKNATDAALHIENAGSAVLLLEQGTENLLQSGTAPAEGALGAAADENASGGAVYARDDLTVTGEGSLTVLGYLNNGIHTTNDLLIQGGSLTVEAVNNGVKGKDSLTVAGGSLSVTAGGDGLKSDDTAGETTGWILLSGGELTVQSGGDAVQAETALTVTGGSLDLFSGGGSAGVRHSADRGWGQPDSGWDLESESETSTKGLKSGTETFISGGTIAVDSRDDAIHSNGSVRVTGGSITAASGDDGIHADLSLVIEDGEITVTGSYEGLEANQIDLLGGTVTVNATDDGINAYGGKNQMGWGGSGKTTAETPNLRIAGGTITVNADGDGLDSNGNLSVEGGVTIVNGPVNGANGALDCGTENGGRCAVSGGTILALGSSGMAETFGETSGQYSFLHNFGAAFAAGDEITVSDSQGNVIFRHTAVKSGSSVVFSSPELAAGGTYTLRAGEQQAEITLTGISTTSGSVGGFGGFGGGHGGGRFDGVRPEDGGFGGFGKRPEGGRFGGGMPGLEQPPEGVPGQIPAQAGGESA